MKEFNGKKVMIMCCSKCNLSCEHCYISYTGDRDPEDLLKIIKNLKEKYRIMLNGGEILTNLDYLQSFKEIGQNYILSNGYEIYKNPGIIDKLREYGIDSISISYHFGIHDEISLISSHMLEQVFQKLKNEEFNFRLMTTITSKNYNLIKEMCEKSVELGAKGLYFTNYILQGKALKFDGRKLILSEEQIKSFFEQLMECRQKYDIKELILERDGGFGKNSLSNHDHFRCPSINDQVILTPDNNIYPCIFMAKPGYEIGKYIDGKIMIRDELFEINDGNICYAKEICNRGRKLIKKIL